MSNTIRIHQKACFSLLFLFHALAASTNESFVYNGFREAANIISDGLATITPDGLLKLSNNTKHEKGHAFYSLPLPFRKPTTSGNKTAFSFSTTFVFAIVPEYPQLGGMGMALVISPSTNFSTASDSQFMGILNQQDNGSPSNHIVAVELDTVYNPEVSDINGNHVGIDVNSLISSASRTAGFYNSDGQFQNLSLISGDPMQVWVEYDGQEMRLNVSLAPFKAPKPTNPLLSLAINLSSIILDDMYVGFSSSTADLQAIHYVLGWSFKMDGVTAPALNYSSLPSLPQSGNIPKKRRTATRIWVPIVFVLVFLLVVVAVAMVRIVRKKKYEELLEDWELEYGPQRFKYRDLYRATGGFREKQLLGIGGFGRVYRGVLPISKIEVAVKKVSHDSRQGSREFIAEVMSIGRLRHRNLVQLLGYCRRKGELLLVYDFMPNGSLDRLLFDRAKLGVDWLQRFRIIKGVALGLLYLHEEWEQVVIHRDVKASNVLLDGEWNGRLGDFGLARLYDHGSEPETTRVAGTMGYIAPELARSGKASTSTDVFAFGAFLLEVACGRRPIERREREEEVVLVDWVIEKWRRGAIVESADQRLGGEYEVDEVELVLKLGLVCSHRSPMARPSMREVVQILDGDANLPELKADLLSANRVGIFSMEGLRRPEQNTCTVMTTSVLFEGR